MLVAGVAAPLVRRRLGLRPPVVASLSAGAPFALCVLRPRTAARDIAACTLQMWAYVAVYQMPHDDSQALRARVHVDYPISVDRVLGAGRLPALRLQRALSRPGRVTAFDRVLIWVHWLWFLTPHAALLYVLACRRAQFPRAAALTYATFDVGLIGYWAVPTAPPWYAADHGRIADPEMPRLRRLMFEYGEQFWGDGWRPLYAFLGGNPLAAMPSLHFATSVMAAHLLTELGVVEGTLGWSYTLALALALVYLGEHYAIDLLAGLALTEAVRRAAPPAAPLFRGVCDAVRRVEAWA